MTTWTTPSLVKPRGGLLMGNVTGGEHPGDAMDESGEPITLAGKIRKQIAEKQASGGWLTGAAMAQRQTTLGGEGGICGFLESPIWCAILAIGVILLFGKLLLDYAKKQGWDWHKWFSGSGSNQGSFVPSRYPQYQRR